MTDEEKQEEARKYEEILFYKKLNIRSFIYNEEDIKQCWLDGFEKGIQTQIEDNFDEETFSKAVEVMNEYDNVQKENARLSQMLELATNDNSRLHLISKGWFNIDKGYDEALAKAKEEYRAELEKRVENEK